MNVNEAMIEISRYSYAISGKTLLHDITLSVAAGEYLSVVGPNGAGKTTLLKCLDRIYTGGRGEIRVAGQRLESYSHKALARIISYVPQADGRLSQFTVYDYVMMGRYPYMTAFSSPGREDTKAVHDALALTETSAFAHRALDTLSGGERQRVLIAAALAQGAIVLLLDEPTTFLDPKHEADVQRLLARVNKEHGVTVISVTHDMNSAAGTSDRILALKNGAVAFCGPAGAFMNNETLRNVYDRTFLFAAHPRTGRNLVAPDAPW